MVRMLLAGGAGLLAATFLGPRLFGSPIGKRSDNIGLESGDRGVRLKADEVVVVLERCTDPRNYLSILKICLALGLKTILLVDPIEQKSQSGRMVRTESDPGRVSPSRASMVSEGGDNDDNGEDEDEDEGNRLSFSGDGIAGVDGKDGAPEWITLEAAAKAGQDIVIVTSGAMLRITTIAPMEA